MATNNTTRTGKRSVNQTVALVFGVVYLLVGLAGFIVTGFSGFASSDAGKSLLGFDVNPLHNIVHLLVGIALIAGSRSLAGAKGINTTVGVVYLLVGLIGLFIANPTNSANILALNGADNVLHLASAIILLAVALAADKSRRSVTA